MRIFIFISQYTAKPNRVLRYLICSGIFFLLFFQIFSLPQTNATSNNPPEHEPAIEIASLPPDLGKVIYSFNENSPKKLYIIGIDHRDSVSRLNGSNTAKVQADVYRIGEWLNRNCHLDLLLPEGFFGTSKAFADLYPARQRAPLDNSMLEQKLTNDARYVNAEMLLMEHFQIPACQVEDQQLYDAVLHRLVKLEDNADDPSSCRLLRTEISHLQERRTAAILQRIPDVIKESFLNGSIKNENALFTIGLNHISTIITYLQQKAIHIQSPSPHTPTKGDDVDLKLIKEGYGVIIIIPNALAHESLKMTRLSGIF
jgi:hypothetical protein